MASSLERRQNRLSSCEWNQRGKDPSGSRTRSPPEPRPRSPAKPCTESAARRPRGSPGVPPDSADRDSSTPRSPRHPRGRRHLRPAPTSRFGASHRIGCPREKTLVRRCGRRSFATSSSRDSGPPATKWRDASRCAATPLSRKACRNVVGSELSTRNTGASWQTDHVPLTYCASKMRRRHCWKTSPRFARSRIATSGRSHQSRRQNLASAGANRVPPVTSIRMEFATDAVPGIPEPLIPFESLTVFRS